jgi:hypothetical protein
MLEIGSSDAMDWIERLKIIAHDPERAVTTWTDPRSTDANGNRYLSTANPPATFEEVQMIESALGMKLPEDLRKVYLEVGNGDFGPGGGLFELFPSKAKIQARRELRLNKRTESISWYAEHFPEVDAEALFSLQLLESEFLSMEKYGGVIGCYRLQREAGNERRREWPKGYLPVCSGGCDYLGVIDLDDGKVGFLQYELCEYSPSDDLGAAPFEQIIEWKASSVQEWFMKWIYGEKVMQYSRKFWDEKMTPMFEIWTDYRGSDIP